MINSFFSDKKAPLVVLFLFLILIPLVSAFNFESTTSDVNVYQGNLTNLSEMQDTNIAGQSDNDVLTWDAGTTKWIADSAAAVGDTNETTRFNTLVGTNCTGTDKVSGYYASGLAVCTADADTGGGNIFDQWLNTTSAVTFDVLNVSTLANITNFTTHEGTHNFHFHSTADDLVLDASSVTGNNYFGIDTEGSFFQLYANPNPGNGYLLATFTETQGADTYVNIYEGGTGHNRFWSSGSVRVGGDTGYLCSNITTDVDCDTPVTGADLVVQDDIWSGGKLFAMDWTNATITESQISDFSIADYYLKTHVDANITSANTTAVNYCVAVDTSTNTSMKGYVDGTFNTNATMNKTVSCNDIVGSPDADFCTDTGAGAEADPHWTANSTLVPYLANENTFAENTTFSKNISQGDNDYHCFGDACDSFIYFNGTSMIISVG